MGLFRDRDPRVAECLRRLDAIAPRLVDDARDSQQLDDRIKALESAPGVDGILDSLAATVDQNASAASSESRATLDAFEELDRRLVQVTLAVAEGIERVDRAERRIRSTVQRARKELANEGFVSDGLEAENAEIRLLDVGGSEADGVPALRLDVGETDAFGEQQHAQPKGIPGHFSQEVLKALRG